MDPFILKCNSNAASSRSKLKKHKLVFKRRDINKFNRVRYQNIVNDKRIYETACIYTVCSASAITYHESTNIITRQMLHTAKNECAYCKKNECLNSMWQLDLLS